MKKLMIAASAALCATVGFSDVTSANVVGYVDSTIKADDYTMIGCNLTSIGNQGVKITDLVCPDGFTPGASGAESDNIEVWRATGSVFYYYWDGDGDESAIAWWGDEDECGENDVIKPGEAIWFRRRGAATALNVSGEVFTAPKSIPIKGDDYSMVTTPYATPLKITDFTKLLKAGPVAGASGAEADNIEVWRPTGSVFYYYWDGDGDESAKAWWGDEDECGDNDVINPGEAVWYRHRKADPTTLDFEGLDL